MSKWFFGDLGKGKTQEEWDKIWNKGKEEKTKKKPVQKPKPDTGKK